ncbi:MAG TPA: gamma-glutamyl-gamma-aminobutyrate hydrolase family protein [Polyangiales bacterium]|nr:gamma-glutamyl-gamma-aminobutyrate hydrolase family protein [Polyangiales bacterium]
MTRPLIGVTGPAHGGHSGWSFSWLALRRAGARVRRLRPTSVLDHLDGLDGVVIGGGAHVEPGRYLQQPSIEYVYDEQRDEFEWEVLSTVMQRGLPVLGICRGAQLLNVFCGGTLYQNLPEDLPGLHLRRHYLARKQVDIVEGTLLAHVIKLHELRVNSLHRQGVRELGRGLAISALDRDGVVQAIENRTPGAFQLGVQWHPEYLLNHAAQRRLFHELVRAARPRAT